ncbi:MAG: lysophospholipid acyltransferase family protein [Candidatus Dormibacteria bacterium]
MAAPESRAGHQAGGTPRPPLSLRLGLGAAAVVVRSLGRERFRLSDVLANAAFAVSARRRRTTIANFRAAFPELSAPQARRLAQRSFLEYGRTCLDFLYVHGLSRGRVVAEVRGAGVEEHFDPLFNSGEPGILVMIHQGSWDVASVLAGARGVPLTVVMADGSNPALADLVVWARARLGVRAVTASKSPRTVLQTLKAGGWLGLIIDIPGDTPSVEVTFLGQRTRFSSAAPILAARTGAPLVPIVAVRGPGGTYLVEVHAPVRVGADAAPEDALQRLIPVFEMAVRRWPEQWFPFADDRVLGDSPA